MENNNRHDGKDSALETALRLFMTALLLLASGMAGSGKDMGSGNTPIKVVECPNFDRCEAEQTNSQWCWAACAQSIYKYHGVTTNQADIVNRIVGDKTDQTAGYFEIMRALSRKDVNIGKQFQDLFNGKKENFNLLWFISQGLEKSRPKLELLTQELERHEPCIIGIMEDPQRNEGHACVIFGMEYSEKPNYLGKFFHGTLFGSTPNNNPPPSGNNISSTNLFSNIPDRNIDIVSAKVFDPWPGMGDTNIDGKLLEKQLQFVLSQTQAEALYNSYDQYAATGALNRPVLIFPKMQKSSAARAAAPAKARTPPPEVTSKSKQNQLPPPPKKTTQGNPT